MLTCIAEAFINDEEADDGQQSERDSLDANEEGGDEGASESETEDVHDDGAWRASRLQAVVQSLETRYSEGRLGGRFFAEFYEKFNSNTPRELLMPSVEDAEMWMVRVKVSLDPQESVL
jgi:hypothetical protein